MKQILKIILKSTTILGKTIKEFFLIAGAVALGGALVIRTSDEMTLFIWGLVFLFISVILSLLVENHEKRVKVIEECLK